MKKYRWLGDRGEISGHVVFEEGSYGRIVELDEAVAADAIAGGFPIEEVVKADKPTKEVTK